MAENTQDDHLVSQPSDTVRRLRETFTPLAETLAPEDEPAIVYKPKPVSE